MKPIEAIIAPYLADPADGSPLTYSNSVYIGADRGYPVIRSVPRFVETDNYVDSFSFEWNYYRKELMQTNRKSTEREFVTRTGFTEEELKGALVLDAGVGAGRIAEIAADWGANVVGTDLSYSVDAAHELVGSRPNIWLAQADILKMPFKPETFDVIFSWGVLHHTPDTRAFFEKLVTLLKPGGTIAIWVYPDIGAYAARKPWVNFINRLPPKAYHDWCVWFMKLALKYKGSKLLNSLWQIFPYPRDDRGIEWNTLDLFDSYSPKFHGIHSEAEVKEWFEAAGLVDVYSPNPADPTCMRGKKPLHAALK